MEADLTKARDAVDQLVHQDSVRRDPSQLRATLRAILEGPCRDATRGALVLVLHGFDPDPRGNLGPTQLVVARAAIGAFSGARTASRLLFTSAARFAVIADGNDLATTLFSQAL